MHSSNPSPLRSPVASAKPSELISKGKRTGINNFNNIHNRAHYGNPSKEEHRQGSDNKYDFKVLMDSFHAQRIQNLMGTQQEKASTQKIEKDSINQLEQKKIQSNKSSSTASSKTGFYNQANANHRNSLEPNDKHTPKNYDKIEQPPFISASEPKNSGRSANNQALQAVFGSVTKSSKTPQQSRALETSQNQPSQTEIQRLDGILHRKGSSKAPKSTSKNSYILPFGSVKNENIEIIPKASKHSDSDIIYSVSNRSSNGFNSRGLNSMNGSRENSPRPIVLRKKISSEAIETKGPRSHNRMLKLSEPSVHLVLNQSLGKEGNRHKQSVQYQSNHEPDLQLEMAEESMKVYKSLKDVHPSSARVQSNYENKQSSALAEKFLMFNSTPGALRTTLIKKDKEARNSKTPKKTTQKKNGNKILLIYAS